MMPEVCWSLHRNGRCCGHDIEPCDKARGSIFTFMCGCSGWELSFFALAEANLLPSGGCPIYTCGGLERRPPRVSEFAQPSILWFGVSARQQGTKFIGFRCWCDFEVALLFSSAHLQLTNTYSCKRGIEYMYPGTNCEPTFKLRCMTAAPIVKPLLLSATKHSRISREDVAQQSRHVKALVFNEFRWAQVFFTGLWMLTLPQVLTELVGLDRFVQRPRCKNSWQSTCCKCAV